MRSSTLWCHNQDNGIGQNRTILIACYCLLLKFPNIWEMLGMLFRFVHVQIYIPERYRIELCSLVHIVSCFVLADTG